MQTHAKMNQQEQKWLVLLYSLMELDGGSQRKNVLRHIQENGYWHKNDQNDVPRTTRNEKAWRNDFSYERQHLVEKGYMQSGLQGIWQITEAGREYVNSLGEKLKDLPAGSETCCTPDFLHRFFQTQVYSEDTADQLLLEQLFREEALEEPLTALSDKPAPKGPAANRSGGRMVYLRDPSVARRALAYAGHRCEVDGTHPSFRRRNADHLYMEPHHLIPMAKTEHFGVSLDREQNIFSLCSNCHNQIHYGTREDVWRIISLLFRKREREIGSILGRDITLEEIYQIYHVT